MQNPYAATHTQPSYLDSLVICTSCPDCADCAPDMARHMPMRMRACPTDVTVGSKLTAGAAAIAWATLEISARGLTTVTPNLQSNNRHTVAFAQVTVIHKCTQSSCTEHTLLAVAIIRQFKLQQPSSPAATIVVVWLVLPQQPSDTHTSCCCAALLYHSRVTTTATSHAASEPLTACGAC